MKFIIGIGNPGEEYRNNRHNIGFMVVDKLKDEKTEKLKNVLIFKSQNFMNDSGKAVKKLVEQYKVNPSDLWIIHDDLDIPLGSYKIQFGVGPKVHGGLNDIEEKLGTKNFWRVRIGVENRDPNDRIPGDNYVLQDFTEAELRIIKKVVGEIARDLSVEI